MRKVIEMYTVDGMKHIMGKMVLMWNNLGDVPSAVAGHESVGIVRWSKNSLNNQ